MVRAHVINRTVKPYDVLLNLFLLGLGLVFLFPAFYALITSFRAPGYGLTSEIIPKDFYWGNYERLFNYGRFPRYLLNSFIDSFGGALLTTLTAALAAYAFARMRFWGRDFFMGFILVMMMLPGLTNLIPLYKIASDLKLLNTYTLMILIFGAYGVPLGIWLMKGFFQSIPKELEEAAAIDGATPVTAFIRVVLPITAPGITATFLINFVYNWNNFFMPLVMTSQSSMKTATVGLYDFQHALEGNQDELLAAACVVIMIPTIIMFAFSRKYLMQGMVEGAVKG
ncbi:MAG: carbohydrate ABC transporter permease [Aggregatilineaceae bacterium]